MHVGIIESFFIIFTGAAALAAVALYTRQPLIVAYIAIGCLVGPHGIALVSDDRLLAEIGEIGIIFLLFLVGLDLPPAKLKDMIGESVLTALASTAVFYALGFGVMVAFGFTLVEALVAGTACVFSSTILGIKLLPTTVLHHRHIGEIVISLLLIQDLLAIIALLILAGFDAQGGVLSTTLTVLVALPVVALVAYLGVRFFVVPLLARFDVFQEFTFLLAVGWCLGIASLSQALYLSWEIGAFVAGVSLANSPIAQYITENLRPLRDFFLVLFFFAVGAAINPSLLLDVWLPTLVLAVVLVATKPPVFRALLRWQKESDRVSREVGYRLGQASEFSLLLVFVAGTALLSAEAAHVVQGATVLTLLLSSYLVVFRYPSPIAVSETLRRD
ncbi:MAG: cation:proton antiporter [Gammaproteobacteria bacterium]|nr:cation:proton antiporter [Gammaproteobacteria bacterium]MDE0443187.1 cation:proton antiporter [Gammaproteobacteria bacterium]